MKFIFGNFRDVSYFKKKTDTYYFLLNTTMRFVYVLVH